MEDILSMIFSPVAMSTFPTLGSLMGTSGSDAIINNINAASGSTTFFGSMYDRYATIRNKFIENIVVPIKAAEAVLYKTVDAMVNIDRIKPLITMDAFKSITPAMHLPILMYEPVRTLFDQGRVSGFGYDPEFLPEEDVYGRLINNGTTYDALESLDDENMVTLDYTYWSDDPVLTDEELDSIEDTRRFVDRILADTVYDPTDIDLERG